MIFTLTPNIHPAGQGPGQGLGDFFGGLANSIAGRNVDPNCWYSCKLQKTALCGVAGLATAGIGATVGGIAMIPSGGVLVGEGAYLGAQAGYWLGWGACQLAVDLQCNQQCESPQCSR